MFEQLTVSSSHAVSRTLWSNVAVLTRDSDGRSFSAKLIQDGILKEQRLSSQQSVWFIQAHEWHTDTLHNPIRWQSFSLSRALLGFYSKSTEPTEVSNHKTDSAGLRTVQVNHDIKDFFLRVIPCLHHCTVYHLQLFSLTENILLIQNQTK